MHYASHIAHRQKGKVMNYLDTRELQDEIDEFEADENLDNIDTERLEALRDLRDEVGDEWQYGVTLVPEDSFEDYARELAEDIGAIPSDYSWPASHIDWTAAAGALRMDYTSADFQGVTYLFRA